MIPAASLVLLLPFYLGSVIVEYIALAARWRNLPPKRLLTSVAVANGLSYLALGLYYACQLWLAVHANSQ